jgi:hypothetical protein
MSSPDYAPPTEGEGDELSNCNLYQEWVGRFEVPADPDIRYAGR